MGEKRVIEQVASNEVHNDDWFLKDSPTQDTSKISATNLKAILGADGTLALEEIANAIAEEFDSTHTYTYDDWVFYEGILYRCIRQSVTGTWDATNWQAKTIKEFINTAKSSVLSTIEQMLGEYLPISTLDPPSIEAISKGDIFIYQRTNKYKFYRAKADHPQGVTDFDIDDWDEFDTVADLIEDVTENAGKVDDVKVDGVSVVDENKVAQITTPDADGISYDNTTSGLESDDVQEAIDEVVTDIESVETALETKADVDGFYDELYAGNLLSDNTETDNAPYTYRPSPSGKSCVDLSVVGGTVAWNQIIPNAKIQLTENVSEDVASNKWGSTIAYVGNAFVNHVVVAICKLSNGKCSISWGANNYRFVDGGSGNTETTTTIGIYKPTQTMIGNSGEITFRLLSGLQAGTYTATINLIDLTQAFGSTIADYIYSLEQAEAGSGIAWLKSYGFLTKDYYAYDSGSLQSVNVASRKIVGKNLLDISKLGSYVATSTGGERIGVPVYLPQGTYTISKESGDSILYLTNIDNNYSFQQITLPFTFTVETPTHYLIRISTDTLSSWDITNLQVEKGDTATSYEPYKEVSYPLDSSLTLRGILKKDANNKLYYDGDIYNADGSVTRKYGIVDLGSLNWAKGNRNNDDTGYIFYVTISTVKNSSIALCTEFVQITAGRWENCKLKEFMVAEKFGVFCANYDDATTFKTAMNGVYLVYELATTTTESAQPFTNPQLVGSTEEFVDAGTSASTPTRDVDIPVGQDSKYHTDLKAKLEELAKIPDVPSTNGTYTLKATRSASGVEYNWVSG